MGSPSKVLCPIADLQIYSFVFSTLLGTLGERITVKGVSTGMLPPSRCAVTQAQNIGHPPD